jgi:hypothetical protein
MSLPYWPLNAAPQLAAIVIDGEVDREVDVRV